ncbi:MAG TPA: hypothetical protein PLJ27_09235 [Polyangiaceae bacterium]|nr:MAG: hypothetical protein BWY17_03772 [Deltaproteobacteria bacterium ADurb.Bin207]HOT12705.1 hypothetical protein [Polyangiaceae bacterium]HPB94662.1 hypothetical protein [Polyangiaceae bacterium]HQB43861.1 hypothetical protein [Polyangiaceae bacterium]HQF23487.1 hypothetical protein [Polyangiaceae bacterium]
MNIFPIQRILALARWAPSGDNTQPWRFQVLGKDRLHILGHDTRAHCVYDLDGHASQIAQGALLETLAIAATTEGLRADMARKTSSADSAPVYEITLTAHQDSRPHPLAAMIEKRAVQRRAMSSRPLSEAHKDALSSSVTGYRILWFEGLAQRWNMARFMAANAKNRLTMPEAYPTHRDIIEWNAQFSDDRVPDRAVGVDPLTTRLMRWALQRWERVRFLNTWLGGTWVPRLQLDLIPGLRCAAHFALVAEQEPSTIDDFVMAGRSLQRLWLTATSLGLVLQPEMTPVIFSRYIRQGRNFTSVPAIHDRAARLAKRLERQLGTSMARHTVAMGRLGYGPLPSSRSLRLPLCRLLVASDQTSQLAAEAQNQ